MKNKFIDLIKNSYGIDYLHCYITYLISPMLTGVKPSSLIGIRNDSKKLLTLWRTNGNNLMAALNLKTFVLKSLKDKEMVLIYNESMLSKIINLEENKKFLQNLGYKDLNNISKTLDILYKRYNEFNCPHEIGIFLGIPLSDVKAFINCSNNDCLLCGYWKVFSNEKEARELFKMYDSSKEMVITYLLQGKKVNWIASTLKNSFQFINN